MKWRITIGEPGPWPKPHRFQVTPPERCGCAWACTDLATAMRIVDMFTFAVDFPEMFEGTPVNYYYVKHLYHIRLVAGYR